ncbi:unnamed protein product [Fraxinus pennsylvanica]|uniref:Uncharacterized protein n=1 Tax=Fraxinus pennsylvanica TaxID=56036 RepID=A0AAD2E985_9LAMI|nr:unnamed protein product [Fraxinus pennsylvanica]
MRQKSQTAAGFTPNTPFTPEVLSYPLPDRFNYPRVKEYDGTTDPINHLNIYTDIMNLQVAPDAVMCKAFPQMRQGPNETLLNFMTMFNKAKLQIPDLHITVTVSALTHAIRMPEFLVLAITIMSKVGGLGAAGDSCGVG